MKERGFDRVQIGDRLLDAISRKRQFEVAGINWNNKKAGKWAEQA